MTPTTASGYTLTLSEQEWQILLDILEEMRKETLVELHRTEAFHAKEVVGTREAAIESVLAKLRERRAG
jgi:hypothetical protein